MYELQDNTLSHTRFVLTNLYPWPNIEEALKSPSTIFLWYRDPKIPFGFDKSKNAFGNLQTGPNLSFCTFYFWIILSFYFDWRDHMPTFETKNFITDIITSGVKTNVQHNSCNHGSKQPSGNIKTQKRKIIIDWKYKNSMTL